MHDIISFFSWPDGSVWGNLVANLFTAIPVWFLAMWRLEHQHKQHQQAIHNQITQEIANVTDKGTI